MKPRNNPKKKVIIITGTPGTGKTVVSNALATQLGVLHINLTELVHKENLVSEVDEERQTIIVDIRGLSKRVREIIYTSPQDVIIEGHYAPAVVPSTLVSNVFVLRRDPEKLKMEFEARGYDELKISENLNSEILDVCLVEAVEKYGLGQVDEIDVTAISINDVVEEIVRVLKGQRQRRVGTVDWLGKLDSEGRLDRILSLLSKT
ncbi:adenylate kinase family protein [Candidatus Bathyarchaeota archaeon]|nr:adenylate kinase family protein [Candidatus Bathyarchaeota archaeon]